MKQPRDPNRTRHWVMILMAVAVLVPSLYGFGTKFLEFVALYRGDVEGAFAISPILNYLLASIGFLLLFGWAMFHGMFRDIERPKFTMLENEERLDQGDTRPLRLELSGPRGSRQSLGSQRFGEYHDYD